VSRGPGRRRDRGLALIVVLWVAALVTLFATSFSFSLRTEARMAGGIVERVRAGAAADAGLRRLIAHMAGQNVRTLSSLAGKMVFDDIALIYSAVPENARIDLNAAPPPLVHGLVARAAAISLEPVDVEAVTDAIVDWRDADDNPLPRGAERRQYEAAGREVLPRDGPFLSIAELSRVLGVTPRLYAAMAPLVTVYAWSPQVAAADASRDVLLSIPGLEEQQVETFLEQRAMGEGSRTAVASLSSGARYLARTGSLVYRLSVEARGAQEVRVVREAVVKFNVNRDRPVAVLAWIESPSAPGG
jgi:general secretion pathway protein K